MASRRSKDTIQSRISLHLDASIAFESSAVTTTVSNRPMRLKTTLLKVTELYNIVDILQSVLIDASG